MGAPQASVIVQLTAVPAVALGGSRFGQRQRAAQQQRSGQKKNAFFQWFLPWAMTGPSLTTIGLGDQFVHSIFNKLPVFRGESLPKHHETGMILSSLHARERER